MRFIFIFFLPAVLWSQRTDTIRMMHYNLLQYGNTPCMSQTTKDRHLRTIFNAWRPDILTVNEIRNFKETVQSLKTNTLNYNTAMTATEFSNTTRSELVNALYYNADKFGYLGATAITGNLRDIDVHRLYHKAGTAPGDTLDWYIIIAHFKASTGDENVQARAAAATSVVNWLRRNPQVQRYTLSGDLNLYSSSEPAWQTLVAGSAPRFVDPAGLISGWRGQAFARFHTQSPSDGTNVCGAEGGMDDRFDFILTNPALADTTKPVFAIPRTFRTFGNEGNTYNTSLDCRRNHGVSTEVCDALRKASDHLPVVLRVLFPIRSRASGSANYDVILLRNPVQEALRFQLERAEPGPLFWDIWDVLGRKVATGKGELTQPNTVFSTPLPDVPAGNYILSVRHAEGIATLVFVKIDG